MRGAEHVRKFMVKRPWLRGVGCLITDDDYASLKLRDGKFWGRLGSDQKSYLLGYVDGWLRMTIEKEWGDDYWAVKQLKAKREKDVEA